MEQDVKKITNQMAFVGILGNVLLAVFKLIAGIVGHSTAMISDFVHTLSDVVATFIAYLGVVLSRKKADDKHP
ncbi:MAG: cation transporter, partial [Butyrivibrio sp.]|nr:cation transporter [Butyrivibrio sp.]